MFARSYLQDIFQRTVKLQNLNNRIYSINYRKLLFSADFFLDYDELSDTRKILGYMLMFVILYELFYFFFGKKFILTNIFFYNEKRRSSKSIVVLTFLYGEFRVKHIQYYLSSFVTYKFLFKLFSSLYDIVAKIDFKVKELHTINFYFSGLLGYYFYFNPNLLLNFKNNKNYLSFRAVLGLQNWILYNRFNLMVLVNTLALNFNEV